jgi:hypothetical protein
VRYSRMNKRPESHTPEHQQGNRTTFQSQGDSFSVRQADFSPCTKIVFSLNETTGIDDENSSSSERRKQKGGTIKCPQGSSSIGASYRRRHQRGKLAFQCLNFTLNTRRTQINWWRLENAERFSFFFRLSVLSVL